MTYYLDPFGCAKNQVDAENMMAFLNRAGWFAAENGEAADLIIINSCGFIESAKQESINAVLSWRKNYPEKKILLAGCLAQRYSRELAETLPEVDAFFGIDDLSGIAEAAAAIIPGRTGPAEKSAEFTDRTGCRPLLSMPGSAYVKISDGCDNHCSYCAIPLIRGRFKSRHVKDIIEECKILLGRGIKELCLIGQDLGSFGKDFTNDPGGLAGLMKALSRLEGDFWIRLLYIHQDNFPMSILGIIEQDKRFLPYFDIPFQHGSEKILQKMNRRGNCKTYLELIEKIRSRFDDAVIRTTFLTGFPGETEEDFELLLDFQQKARVDWLGCFAYSREEDTPAFGMKGRVAKKLSIERRGLVEERQIPITEKQMERFVSRNFEVLVEEKFEAHDNDKQETLYLGRLPFQAPEVDGAAVIISSRALELGAKLPCRVIARRGIDLEVKPR